MKAMLVGIAAALLLGAASAAVWAQTCRDDISETAPDSRFTDNGDGTVMDLSTGLIWKQCAEGLSGAGCANGIAATLTWQQALQYAADSGDWRLPNKNELGSLVERRCYWPAINETVFPNTPSSEFWSSSPHAYWSGIAWYVHFSEGAHSDHFTSSALYVRLVRGGQ